MATSTRTSDARLRSLNPIRDQVDGLLKLEKAAKKINSILDLDQLIDKVVNDIAISFGCLEANIYLRDVHGIDMILTGIHGCTLYGKGQRLRIGKDGMVGYVAATGQLRYAPDVSKDPYYVACQPAVRSEVAIPLEADGQVIGVFSASHHDLNAFPNQQIRLLQSLCSHVAVAVQNAQLFQQERQEKEHMRDEAQEARLIQEALFPKASPYVPGFAISGLSSSAGAVGGDWYDFIDLDDGRWGLVLADVSGKGTAAALLMSATRGMLRSLAGACSTPAEVLTKLNRLMVQDFPSARFVTMVYAVLDPTSRTLTFTNAGHLPPLLVDSSGSRFLDTQEGMPLGLSFGVFSETTVHLEKGSQLILYSDGITEAANAEDEEYGQARLEKHFVELDACAESILQHVRSFSAPAALYDDATVIVVKVNA